MRKWKFVFVSLVVALTTISVVATPAMAKEKVKKVDELTAVDVPDGYVAVIAPGKHSYKLFPGSEADFGPADDGTGLQALTEEGQRIHAAVKFAVDMKKAQMSVADTLFMGSFAELRAAPVEEVSCDGNYEGGRLLRGTDGAYHCVPVSGANCSYWHEVCTLN